MYVALNETPSQSYGVSLPYLKKTKVTGHKIMTRHK